MQITKTLCDCCGVELKEQEKNAIEFDFFVKVESDRGNIQKETGQIITSGWDMCDSCTFRAIERRLNIAGVR